ncbi:hypothetical protein K8R30_04435 [archaeon]|nr:hypothetical protein [archaeon]
MEFRFFRSPEEIVNGMNGALKYSEVDSLRLGKWRDMKVPFWEKLGKKLARDASEVIKRGSFDLLMTNEIGLFHFGEERTVGNILVNKGYYSPLYGDGFYEKVSIAIRDNLDFGDGEGRTLYPFRIEMEKSEIGDKLTRKNQFYGGNWGVNFLGNFFGDECFVKQRPHKVNK